MTRIYSTLLDVQHPVDPHFGLHSGFPFLGLFPGLQYGLGGPSLKRWQIDTAEMKKMLYVRKIK